MRGSVHKVCGCRDPQTGRRLRRKCPRLKQHSHGSWEYVLDLPGPGGRRRQLRRAGFGTRREAEAALERARAQLRDGVELDDQLTVSVWLTSWLAEKTKPSGVSAVGRTLRASTARMYVQHVHSYLIPQLGHLRLVALRAEHISAAYEEILAHPLRSSRPMSPATLRRVHATLRSALNAAVRSRRIRHNPALFVTLPEARRPTVTPWSATELAAFLEHAAGHRLGSLYEVMAFTGLRRGEALGLHWADVDLERQIITVRQQLVQVGSQVQFGRPKTASGEDRVVDLDEITTALLAAHHHAQQEEKARAWGAYQDQGLVFAREDGRPLSPENATKTFTRLIDEVRFPDDADLPDEQRRRLRRIRLHDLRHGQASLMLAAGVPLAVVSKRLGHSTITITSDTYSHLLEGVGREAATRAARLVPRRHRPSETVREDPVRTGPDSDPSSGGLEERFRRWEGVGRQGFEP